MNQDKIIESYDDSLLLKETFLRYLSFWHLFLLSISIFCTIAFFYLRYTDNVYYTTAKIEVLDKSMDSEMALPTSLTIFNRSTVNLENEIEVIKSHRIISQVVSELSSNIKYLTKGKFKDTQNHSSEWLNGSDYNLTFHEPIESIKKHIEFKFRIENNKLYIDKIIPEEDYSKSYFFDEHDTSIKKSDLPFSFSLNSKQLNLEGIEYQIILTPFNESVEYFVKNINVSPIGKESDLLSLSLNSYNTKVARGFINTVIEKFNQDGIIDRQLVFKRTINFVNSRFDLLKEELDAIELQKQIYKEQNNLTDIKVDAGITSEKRSIYDAELFSTLSQLDLIKMLKSTINNNYDFMPVNIGIEDSNVNILINNYNEKISERNKYISSAGENNVYINNIEGQLKSLSKNVITSIENYQKALNIKIDNFKIKEKEYGLIYSNVPKKERILRSIEREQEIKEALFLLLLQKREEAAINFAVTKPSIKIVDSAISDYIPISPNSSLVIFIALFTGFFIPFSCIYLWFLFDTKIHTRDHLLNNTINLPIVGEIPHILNDNELKEIVPSNSREPLAESIRMILANLNYALFSDSLTKKKNNLILVTSSIKGEGKTIVSVNSASILSSKFEKVLLIGADLRNPQIHKFLKIDKKLKGLSDFIYAKDADWKDYIIKHDKLDILLSGTIPPNPTELLSSNKFKFFLDEVKDLYDYIVVDSAPCLLVSDTFEISKYIDTTLYVVRSNFSDIKLCSFINECNEENKLSNINLILNSIGNNNNSYGYKYGYRYGYKYGYNYGYGYGYSEDKN
tara:strand:- start:668 stop:3052 length:2385 start_codon:yes stop_codon:yes gene_type:complete